LVVAAATPPVATSLSQAETVAPSVAVGANSALGNNATVAGGAANQALADDSS